MGTIPPTAHRRVSRRDHADRASRGPLEPQPVCQPIRLGSACPVGQGRAGPPTGPSAGTPGAPTDKSPDFDAYTKQGKTLVLYHNGHETSTCVPNYDGVVDYFNELGFDVMEFMMPLLGCNARPDLQPAGPSHQVGWCSSLVG